MEIENNNSFCKLLFGELNVFNFLTLIYIYKSALNESRVILHVQSDLHTITRLW